MLTVAQVAVRACGTHKDSSLMSRPHQHQSLSKLKSFIRIRYVAPLVLLTLFTSFYLAHDSLPDVPRSWGWTPSREVHVLQEAAYTLYNARRPECEWTPWHEERYAPLSANQSDTSIFLAMNFYENAEIVPTFMQEMPHLLRHLGPQNVYVSVLENGSNDKTPELLHLCMSAAVCHYFHLFTGFSF